MCEASVTDKKTHKLRKCKNKPAKGETLCVYHLRMKMAVLQNEASEIKGGVEQLKDTLGKALVDQAVDDAAEKVYTVAKPKLSERLRAAAKGSSDGFKTGGAVGAVAGTVIPGVGTFIAGAAGALAGAFVGGMKGLTLGK